MTTYQSVLLNVILALLIAKENASVDLNFRFRLPADKYELLVALVQSCRRWGMFSYVNMLGQLNADAPLALIWVNTEETKRFGLALYKVCRLSACSGTAGESADGRINELLTLADMSFCMPDNDMLWNTRSAMGSEMSMLAFSAHAKDNRDPKNWISEAYCLLYDEGVDFDWL